MKHVLSRTVALALHRDFSFFHKVDYHQSSSVVTETRYKLHFVIITMALLLAGTSWRRIRGLLVNNELDGIHKEAIVLIWGITQEFSE
jgi:hypothetical protein